MQGFLLLLQMGSPMKDFISRINWRQILVHTIAFWFFIHAFETLSYLFHLKIIDAAFSSNANLEKMMAEKGITTEDLSLFLFWKSISGTIGLIAALLLSLFLSIKRNWFWLNAFIAFVLMFLLRCFHVTGWDYLKSFFYYPGSLFTNTLLKFLIDGIILLIPGLLLFFSKSVNRFITGSPQSV